MLPNSDVGGGNWADKLHNIIFQNKKYWPKRLDFLERHHSIFNIPKEVLFNMTREESTYSELNICTTEG